MAAGGSPFDALPDELVARVLFEAAQQDCDVISTCGGISLLDRDTQYEESEMQPNALFQLRLISRRFRRVAAELPEQPQLWQRLLLCGCGDAAVRALVALPEKTRAAIRSLCVAESRLSFEGIMQLCRQFGSQLTNLSLCYELPAAEEERINSDHHREMCTIFRNRRGFGRAAPEARKALAGLAALQHMRQLQSLYLDLTACSASPALRGDIVGAGVQSSLSCMAGLHLQALELNGVLVTVETLRSLTGLAGTLKALSIQVLFAEGYSPAPVFSSIGKLERLERLSVGFAGTPVASAFDVQPLSDLVNMRALRLCCRLESLAFAGSMTQLESADIQLEKAVLSPLLAAAKSLRALDLLVHAETEDSRRDLLSTLPRLTNLEFLALGLSAETYLELARSSMKPWTGLASVSLETRCYEEVVDIPPLAAIPAPFLQRLASDVPSLRDLTLSSPLNLPKDLPALACLNRLRRLTMHVEDGYWDLFGFEMDEMMQAALRATLMNVDVDYV